jgi:hypothetical protein
MPHMRETASVANVCQSLKEKNCLPVEWESLFIDTEGLCALRYYIELMNESTKC